jgi:RND superfamily putative drug exporter
MAHPVISLFLSGGILVAALIPFFGINTGFAGVSTLPDDLESKQAFLILDEKFSFGEVTPAEIVIQGEISSPAVQAGIERLKKLLAEDSAFSEPRELEVSDSGTVALLAVPVAGDTSGDASIAAVTRLHDQYVVQAFAGVDANVYITGETAFNIEFFAVSARSAWIVFPFVLGISFLLLTVVFRSLLLPIKAIILNLLAVGAAYGILVLVFQEGFLASTFGFQESPIIEAWIPLFLFTILFGLSMDYHVFLLSRIRERFDQTGDNVESVAFGIRSTGRLITGAALIMVAVFWGFAAGSLVGLQQMGFGLGIAILLDATIVRTVMVPASMRLLGKWNWYLPSWLEWIPNVRFEPAELAKGPAPADD